MALELESRRGATGRTLVLAHSLLVWVSAEAMARVPCTEQEAWTPPPFWL